MTKIIYEEPRKARVIDADGVRETVFKHRDIVYLVGELTYEDGDKFYCLCLNDLVAGAGWCHTRFELLEEETPPEITKETPKELTLCEKLGYKVGDRFVMTENEGVKGFNIGDEVILIKDDGSECPKFFSTYINNDMYIWLTDVRKLDSESTKETTKETSTKTISIKEFLESMPKSADAGVFLAVGKTTIYVYGSEFYCTTEERLQEVMAALIVLYKEEV